MVLTINRARAIRMWGLLIGAALAAAGCGGAARELTPLPAEALRESKIASIAGLEVRLTDGSAIILPDELPRVLLETKGLAPIDAQIYSSGAMLRCVCLEPPAKLAARLDGAIAAQGWKLIQDSDTANTSSRSYRKGEWVIEVSMRTEDGLTQVTTQMEIAELGPGPQ